MTSPLGKSILCPILIGRDLYLDVLKRRLAQTRDGQGQIVLLAGEAGIGKSRLAGEAKVLAEQLGFTIAQGSCFEPDRTLAPTRPVCYKRATPYDDPTA